MDDGNFKVLVEKLNKALMTLLGANPLACEGEPLNTGMGNQKMDWFELHAKAFRNKEGVYSDDNEEGVISGCEIAAEILMNILQKVNDSLSESQKKEIKSRCDAFNNSIPGSCSVEIKQKIRFRLPNEAAEISE